MTYIIDRFEDDYAVLEQTDGEMVEILRSKIPVEAKEGDVLTKLNDSYIINAEETDQLRKEIEILMDELFVD